MDREVARDLLPLVNDVGHMDALKAYGSDRINILKAQLSKSEDMMTIFRLQGQIMEAERLHSLRDEALQKSRENYSG